MKKALLLINSSSGLYDFRGGLIKRLVAEGYDVLCGVPDDLCVKELRGLGARVVRTDINRRGMNPVQDVKLFRGYRALIRKEKPDVVLTYTIKPNIYGGYAARREGVPYIATLTGLGSMFQECVRGESAGTGTMTHFSLRREQPLMSAEKRVIVPVPHDSPLQRLVTAMYRTALKECACVFFQNEENRSVFEMLRIPSGKTRLVNGSGVDLERHLPEGYPGHAETEVTTFLYVGRLMREKGSIDLLRAMERLHDEAPGSVCLQTVGYTEQGEQDAADELQVLTERALSAGYLTQHPYDTDIHPYYTAADAVVMPSYHEGMSNVLMEASATARPVLASDIPGCREAVEDGATGFLFPARDTDALYDAMRRFVRLPVAERRMMGAAARRKMEAQFDRAAVVDAYMEEIRACT